MSRAQVQSYYTGQDQSGERYNARRFASAGGRAVSRRELAPFGRWLDLREGQRLLDAGSGTGRVLSLLSEEQLAQATALDASPAMLEFLARTYPRAARLQGDLFAVQPEGLFDVVTSLRVLDHFPLADQETLLRRFLSFLRPGGRIIVSVLVGPTLESWANRLAKAGYMNYFQRRSEYRELFARCGLRVRRRFDAFVLPRGVLYRLPRGLAGAVAGLDRAAGAAAPWLCSYMTVELVRAGE